MSKIAILVNERQAEAIRMASGITLLDDEIELVFLDTKLDGLDDTNMMMEIAAEMELPMHTNMPENAQMNYMATEELQTSLLSYDHVISY